MATNQLLPFANGDLPNVLPFEQWSALAARLTGFQSGVASSQQFNYILAQGGAAGYVIGQMVADFAGQDATLDAEELYRNFKNAVAACSVPPGTIISYGGKDVPDGYLLCNGANVSRTTYARLFSVIGTNFGAGDGSTTFTLPNLNGRVLQGVTDTSKVGQYLEASLPNITGEIYFRNAADETIWTYLSGVVSSNGSTTNVTRPYLIGSDNSVVASKLKINATSGNSIYSGVSLQPAASQVLMIIKT